MHKSVALSSLLPLELVDLQCCVSWCTGESAQNAQCNSYKL